MRQGALPRARRRPRTGLLTQLLERAVSMGLLAQHPVDRDFWRTQLKPPTAHPEGHEQVKAFTEAQARRSWPSRGAVTPPRRLRDRLPLRVSPRGTLWARSSTTCQWNLVQGQRVRQLAICASCCGARPPAVAGPPKAASSDGSMSATTSRGARAPAAERPAWPCGSGWRPVPPWVFVTPDRVARSTAAQSRRTSSGCSR